MFEILAFSFLIMLASLVGVVSVWKKAGSVIERNLNFLVSFSAGVFLVITYQLGKETIEHSQTSAYGLLWIGLGALGVWFIFKLAPTFHYHPAKPDEENHNFMIDPRRIMASDAIHNIGDGILLAASFATSFALGASAAASVFIHELVQETSEFFVLRRAGYPTQKALGLNFLVSGTILIGAVGGFFLLEGFEILEAPILGLAAGSFFVVVLHDLIPHSVRSANEGMHYFKHGLWFLLGVLVMLAVNAIAVH